MRERLVGLTEMLPDGAWSFLGQAGRFSYWLARRSLWVVATSVALLALPPFIEQQRLEIEEMQNMQKKQVGWVCVRVCVCVCNGFFLALYLRMD